MLADTLKLIVFDLDGTVADTLGPTFRCFQEAVKPVLGREPTREEVLARFGPADHRIIADWVGEDEAPDAIARLYDCYRKSYTDIRPFPGMVEFIKALRDRGRKIALFTGRGRPSTDVVLRNMGLSSLFDFTVTGEEVAAPKPAPDGLQHVMETLNTQAEDTVFVGDTVSDLMAARTAGVHFVAALWDSPERDRLAREAPVTAADIDDLRGLLLEDPDVR